MRIFKYIGIGWRNKYEGFWVIAFFYLLGSVDKIETVLAVAIYFSIWLIGLFFYGKKLYNKIYEN